MGSIWFWEPHLGDRFLTICLVWQVCSAEGVNLRTDLKYLYSSRAMYLLQSCITFCTVYNKESCFLFLPDCLGSCFACAMGGAPGCGCGGCSGPGYSPSSGHAAWCVWSWDQATKAALSPVLICCSWVWILPWLSQSHIP